MSLEWTPIADELSFGARVSGLTRERLADETLRQDLRTLFEARGLILFEDVEPSSHMHVALSNVFGPMKDHPVASVPRVDGDALPGVIDMKHNPDDTTIVEFAGKRVSHWLPWHFDHCYNNELNRAGVLRAIDIADEGGLTGFADGIELYRNVDPELLSRIEGRNVIYTLDLSYEHMRFGLPEGFRVLHTQSGHREMAEKAKTLPRAIHPAVWTRASGEKVLHVSPWMAVGIEQNETAEGDAALEAMCQEIVARVKPYFHRWKPTDMLIWDNWRMLHSVSGHDPSKPRRMQRTTIKGDYGLGYFEAGAKGGKVLEMTV